MTALSMNPASDPFTLDVAANRLDGIALGFSIPVVTPGARIVRRDRYGVEARRSKPREPFATEGTLVRMSRRGAGR